MSITLPKPKIGDPCNGCGICCHIQLCNTGAFLLKQTKFFGEVTVKGKCPALVSLQDGGYACGLIVKPEKFIKSKYRPEVISRTVATLIGAGNGCDDVGLEPTEYDYIAQDLLLKNLTESEDYMQGMKKAYDILLKF